jgi:hypothetical protein
MSGSHYMISLPEKRFRVKIKEECPGFFVPVSLVNIGTEMAGQSKLLRHGLDS